MATSVGDKVRPRYKGNHEWTVKGIAELDKPVRYQDEQRGDVSYDPKILLLQTHAGCSALWFNYWMSTKNTGGKMKWGGGPPVLEEYVLLELLGKAIRDGLLSQDFLNALFKEIKNKLEI